MGKPTRYKGGCTPTYLILIGHENIKVHKLHTKEGDMRKSNNRTPASSAKTAIFSEPTNYDRKAWEIRKGVQGPTHSGTETKKFLRATCSMPGSIHKVQILLQVIFLAPFPLQASQA
jgi:hypothetical protein